MITDLYEYSNLERRLNEYELAYQSKSPGSYSSNLEYEFIINYLAILGKYCPKGSKVANMRNKIRVLMRGVLVDVSNHNIIQSVFIR